MKYFPTCASIQDPVVLPKFPCSYDAHRGTPNFPSSKFAQLPDNHLYSGEYGGYQAGSQIAYHELLMDSINYGGSDHYCCVKKLRGNTRTMKPCVEREWSMETLCGEGVWTPYYGGVTLVLPGKVRVCRSLCYTQV